MRINHARSLSKCFCFLFLLSRFPNNLALVQDPTSKFGVSVLWVTDIFRSSPDQPATMKGFTFNSMHSSYVHKDIDFADFHSYIVQDLAQTESSWRVCDSLLGKGFGLDLQQICARVSHPRERNHNEAWLFHLLDHCLC